MSTFLDRDSIDAALIVGIDAMLIAAVAIGLVFLFGGHPAGEGRCAISQNEAMPWVQEQRAGCPEEMP